MPKRSRFEMELHYREFVALMLGAGAVLGAVAPADAQSGIVTLASFTCQWRHALILRTQRNH
jgi:hypothetical protein